MNTNIFRTLAISASVLFVLAFLPAQIVFAQGPGSTAPGVLGFTLNFDENGKSLLNGGPNPNPVVPISGGGLQFWLPQQVAPGFVLIQAPHDSTAANPLGDTDLLTFTNQLNTTGNLVGVMLFESLIDDTDASLDLADVKSFHYPVPIITIQEFGVEGNNGFQWIPDPNNAFGAVYNGISDSLVPEPSTFVLGGLGLLSLAALAYRRSRWAKTL